MSKKRRPSNKTNKHRVKTSTTENKGQKSKYTWIIPMITIIIAVPGGIFGFLQIRDYNNRTKAVINFDPDNSRFLILSSNDDRKNGKTALVLLRTEIVGAGEKEFYINKIVTSVFCNNKWFSGLPLHPKIIAKTDSVGITKNCIVQKHFKGEDTHIIYLVWSEDKPEGYPLKEGQPIRLSYACYYDIPAKDRYSITKLRVEVQDFLGNRFKTVVKTDSLMYKKLGDVFLELD